MDTPFIVGFGGTVRENSSGEVIVRAVLEGCAELGGATQFFGGEYLRALPHFVPGDAARNPDQIAFVEAIRKADGIVIGTPGYHGGVSGLVKNAIDLLEDTRDDDRPYFDDKPVGLVVTAAGWQAGGITLAALRNIVHAMRGWPTPIGIAVNTLAQRLFDGEGALAEATVKDAAAAQARQIMRLARCPRSAA